MSTKCTIDHGPNNTTFPDQPKDVDYHFFRECYDDDNVYLELTDCPFIQTKFSRYKGKLVTTMAIPGRLWNHLVRLGELRSVSGEDFDNPRTEEQRAKAIEDGLQGTINMLEEMKRRKANDTN